MTVRPGIAAVAALDDDLRHGMYEYIRRAGRPVTRDEAASSVGISRKLAAFHLDKLVDAGLLSARPADTAGARRVGRRPTVYEPAAQDVCVSIPQRRHDLLAELLVDAALAERPGETAREAGLRVAAERGHALGAAERERSRPGRLGTERALTLAESVLAGCGFEPERSAPTCVRLRSCPFHPVVARAPELVCGLNQALLSGVLAGLAAGTVRAELVPGAGGCCVELRG
ncbi:helix-turn-helix domain-containing protein [Kutzneria viridogrisea]|uniref:ArsR family transcriptional regulator n=2 Tax=Kutzneria TaxID=43356 RepID=A0ABR6BP35_9PSEU|nr:transcriptional regulator [Kutzneria albida]AHH96439.1 putative transcription regulator [Kutzneria albida DSM 43870]MBA8928344.1 putative ArsR family transcriptional regulator [Kutzneria viridogrisea]